MNDSHKNLNFKNKGFSLTEALVVVTVMGALSAIAIPAFVGYKADTEKRQLFSKVNSFHAAAAVCLMDNDLTECGSKVASGFYCPKGCSEVYAGPDGQTNQDRLSVLITLNDSKACVSYTEGAVKNLIMKGVCHNSAGIAKFPFISCETNADCSPGTCYSGPVKLKSNKVCQGDPNIPAPQKNKVVSKQMGGGGNNYNNCPRDFDGNCIPEPTPICAEGIVMENCQLHPDFPCPSCTGPFL